MKMVKMVRYWTHWCALMCEHLSLSLSLSLSFHARDEDEYGLEEDEADALRKHSGGDKHHAPAEATHFNSHHEGEEEEKA